MAITLSTDDLPTIQNSDQGEELTLKLTVRQTSATNDGEAEFEIVSASSRPATQEETQEKMDFDEASAEAAAETLRPSTTGMDDEQNAGV